MNTSTTGVVDSDNYVDVEKNVEIAFKIIIYVFGVVGNLLVIFVILFLAEYKKITHWYVLQMALADLIFMQIIPFKVSEDIHREWIHAKWLCSAQQTVLFFTYYASILFLMIMAIDRYLAVCHPLANRIQRLRTITVAYAISLVAWIVALVLSVPVMLYSNVIGIQPNCMCSLHFPKDPLEWCIKNGLTGDRTQKCLEETFPNTHAIVCSSSEDFGGSSFDEESGADYFGSGLFNLRKSIAFELDEPFGDTGGTTNTSETETALPSTDVQDFGTLPVRQYEPACMYDPERYGFITFAYFNFIVMFIVPLLVIVFCYGFIIHRLSKTSAVSDRSASQSTEASGKKSRKSKRSNSSATSSRTHKEKIRVTMLCAILALLFTICWLPFHSVHIAKVVGIEYRSSNFCDKLGIITIMLAYLSSATNPYLYNFLGSFSKRWKQIKNHKRTQSFLSATGLTRASATPTSIVSSSEGTKGQRHSVAKNGKSEIAPESVPLRTMDSKV